MELENSVPCSKCSSTAPSVKLKILGENMHVIKEFPMRLKLKLSSDKIRGICTVQFLDGERVSESRVTVMVAVIEGFRFSLVRSISIGIDVSIGVDVSVGLFS